MSSQVSKELLGFPPLSGQTRGEDIANAVQKCLEDNNIDLNKIISIATEMEPEQFRYKTGATFDTNYFSTVIKKKNNGEFSDRFEQFKTNKTTLAFIVNSRNTNSNEIRIEKFRIDTESLEMQLIDLKSKALWGGKITELKKQIERVGGPEMYVRNARKVDSFKRDATN
ncbi:uncharacterized protein TNCV_4542051 [Trichonephila clavipes]|nr:uncharacterized protein TNCV_4542051 [Trichonephila clavipes]